MTIEAFYLWIIAACLLAFIAGFSSGVWATLHILQRWRRQWQTDREQPAAPELQSQETPPPIEPTANITPLTPPHIYTDGDSFERPRA